MSIVRVGVSEKQSYSEGYEAIFGKKKSGSKKAEAGKTAKNEGKKKAKKK